MGPGRSALRARRAEVLRRAGSGRRIVVTLEPENLFYITGFWGEAGGVLREDGTVTIVAPELEAGRAEAESVDSAVEVAPRGRGLVGGLVESAGGRAAGREMCADCRDYSAMSRLRRAAPGALAARAPFDGAREVKDRWEISVLGDASAAVDELFGLCASEIRAGMKESELQALLVARAAALGLFDTGYRSTLNPLIVAGGPNGALPHAQVSGRRFAAGDLVVVDITLRHRGYVTDATRTFGLGRVPARARDAHGAVLEAQEAGLRAAVRGAACGDVDAACRNVLEGRGYGEYFTHSTGHGIGLDVHEQPAVSRGSGSVLAPGTAMTVEPGAYVPGKFGVRIEDSLVVAGGGRRPRVLHRFPKGLMEL